MSYLWFLSSRPSCKAMIAIVIRDFINSTFWLLSMFAGLPAIIILTSSEFGLPKTETHQGMSHVRMSLERESKAWASNCSSLNFDFFLEGFFLAILLKCGVTLDEPADAVLLDRNLYSNTESPVVLTNNGELTAVFVFDK